MAFSLDLGFTKEEGTSATQTSGTQDIDRQRTEELESERTTQATETEKEKTLLLDPETQNLLRGLVQNLGAQVPSGQAVSELAGGIAGRAEGADAFFQAQIAPILSEARRQGTHEITRLFTDLATASGSSLNSIVRGATASSVGELESRLAATGGQLAIESREAGTRELQGALQGLQGAGTSQVSNIANILQQLRGATAETERETVAEESETTKALETLNEIVKSITSGTSQTQAESSGFSFGIGI